MKVERIDTLDALRGFAMVWMTVFHLCFDLSHAGLIQQNFYRDPVWTWQRVMIVSLFLFCAGFGQAKFHLLWRSARHGGDADRGAADSALEALVVADRCAGNCIQIHCFLRFVYLG